MSGRRGLRIRAALIAACCAVLAWSGGAAAGEPANTVTLGPTGTYPFPDDTPASPFIDRDGQFYFQSSASLYGAQDPRYWDFYRGTSFDDGMLDQSLSSAVNPANPLDRNDDTTWRCNNSPTGLTATPAPGSGYAQPNYCDLLGVWVDPDSGNWYGLVHNEFTPVPFPGVAGFQHYDAIDYAVSTDQGHTWTIKGHAITSPYSTTRDDSSAFPNQTWDYGDGDPRLYVDYKSGYFYVFYGSRIQNKSGAAQTDSLAHVARAPIAGKMASGSWRKWYAGSWSQPGIGGRESNMVPVDATHPTGFTTPAGDYNPLNQGTVNDQIAAGELPTKSPLLVMNITYDAYLGLYIGEPETVDQSAPAPQQYYATADLGTQEWRLIGDSGNYQQDSWYRWIVDGVNHTNPTVVGKTFRAYCSIACSDSDGEFVDVTIDGAKPARRLAGTYRIANATGRELAQQGNTAATTSQPVQAATKRAQWRFVPDGDGSYRVVNAASGKALGVDSSRTSQRAWGTAPTVTALGSDGPTVGQQWFVVGNPSRFRLVNRYSGLVLGLSDVNSRRADTTPYRNWTGAHRTAGEQTLRVIPG